MDTNNCPTRPTWVNCVAGMAQGLGQVRGPACEFTLDVPVWHPSPDDAAKKGVAGEIFQEVQGFGGPDAKAIYIRDFNLNDPEIEIYVIHTNGEPEFLG